MKTKNNLDFTYIYDRLALRMKGVNSMETAFADRQTEWFSVVLRMIKPVVRIVCYCRITGFLCVRLLDSVFLKAHRAE